MLMSFLMETAIHDDREARRRRIFFVIRVAFEVNFDDWLADSKQAWDQRRFEMRTKRQIKRRRKTLVKM